MTEPLIIIVILNTNRREDTLDCLASLVQSSYANYKIMVLDNASTDGSAAAIQRAYPQVEVVALTENKGYAGNNNVGIAAALAQGADWVLVLNEDTILDPDCLTQLTAVGESAADIGIVGPLVYHFNEPTIIQSAGGVMDGKLAAWHTGENEPDRGQFQTPQAVQWISWLRHHGAARRDRAVGHVGRTFLLLLGRNGMVSAGPARRLAHYVNASGEVVAQRGAARL
jgi:GT2 family glycosyltransferase